MGLLGTVQYGVGVFVGAAFLRSDSMTLPALLKLAGVAETGPLNPGTNIFATMTCLVEWVVVTTAVHQFKNIKNNQNVLLIINRITW